MIRGLLALTWLELKIFLREPMGAIGRGRHGGRTLVTQGR